MHVQSEPYPPKMSESIELNVCLPLVQSQNEVVGKTELWLFCQYVISRIDGCNMDDGAEKRQDLVVKWPKEVIWCLVSPWLVVVIWYESTVPAAINAG